MKTHIVIEPKTKLKFLVPVIRSTTGNCDYAVPHVFQSDIMPPPGSTKCLCGKQTWDEAEAEAFKRCKLKMNLPAAQPPTSPFPTVQHRTRPSEPEGRAKEKSAPLLLREPMTMEERLERQGVIFNHAGKTK